MTIDFRASRYIHLDIDEGGADPRGFKILVRRTGENFEDIIEEIEGQFISIRLLGNTENCTLSWS